MQKNFIKRSSFIFLLIFAFISFSGCQALSQKPHYTIVMIMSSSALKYPLAFIPSMTYIQSQQKISSLTKVQCQALNKQYHSTTMFVLCLRLSLVPQNPKKFQFLAINGFIVTSMQGYDTYKKCNTIHADGTCYRVYIINSDIQMKTILNSYLHKYNQ